MSLRRVLRGAQARVAPVAWAHRGSLGSRERLNLADQAAAASSLLSKSLADRVGVQLVDLNQVFNSLE